MAYSTQVFHLRIVLFFAVIQNREALSTNCGSLTSIQELFDMIVDYPESQPAITDLRSCLQWTDQRAELVASFNAQYRPDG